jgi:signal transduction histidine kinase
MRLPARIDRRWVVDAAIALAVTAAQLGAAQATLSWNHHHPHTSIGWGADLLLGVGGLALLARRRFPVPVLAVALGTALWAGAISHAGMIWLVPIAALFNAVIARKRVAAIASVVIGYAVSFRGVWTSAPGHASPAVALGVAAWLIVLLAIAEVVRIRSQRAAAIARSREDQLQRRASEERMRIARDLHDVLAHNISVINVQASTALHLMDRQPERAREALTAIHEVSKQALNELRSVLGVLRTADDDPPRTPSPGLSQLGDLLRSVRSAGLDARLTVTGDWRELPAEADLGAYRIIQEALTNATRHSASPTARVQVGYEAAGVRIQVDDDGPARVGGKGNGAIGSPQAGGNGGPGHELPHGGGNGITGMRERAHALGGTLEAGPRSDGGFRVSAFLPAPDDTGTPRAPSSGAYESSVAGGIR